MSSASGTHRLILLGPPGSGKGTHAERLKDKYGLEHISTGDLLRAEIAAKTELGKAVESSIAEGKLVSDETMCLLLKSHLSTLPAGIGYMLDGFPRTANQARKLIDLLKDINMTLSCAIELSVPSSLLVTRILGRWIHTPSGRSYHETLKPPSKMDFDEDGTVIAAYDDSTGEPLIRRSDDTEVTVRSRIATYDKEISDIRNFFTNNSSVRYENILSSVFEDTCKSIDAILQ